MSRRETDYVICGDVMQLFLCSFIFGYDALIQYSRLFFAVPPA